MVDVELAVHNSLPLKRYHNNITDTVLQHQKGKSGKGGRMSVSFPLTDFNYGISLESSPVRSG